MAASGARNDDLASVTFNQDKSAFVAATSSGFRVYNTEPLVETFRREFEGGGGLGYATMLFRTSTLGLIGGGDDPKFSPVQAVVWDETHDPKDVIHLEFKSLVRSVRVSRTAIVVVLSAKTLVFSLSHEPQLLFEFSTCTNDAGVVALSPSSSTAILALPAKRSGYVRLVDIASASGSATLFKAHEHDIAIMELNADGTVLATASTEGTLIRTWDTRTGRRLREVRRGKTKETICSIAFNYNSDYMAVSSLKGTIHLFSLADTGSGSAAGASSTAAAGGAAASAASGGDAADPASNNSKSILSGISAWLPKSIVPAYFGYEWSFAQFRMGGPIATALAFGREANTLYAIGMDGSYSKLRFDTEGDTSIERESFVSFLDLPPADQ